MIRRLMLSLMAMVENSDLVGALEGGPARAGRPYRAEPGAGAGPVAPHAAPP